MSPAQEHSGEGTIFDVVENQYLCLCAKLGDKLLLSLEWVLRDDRKSDTYDNNTGNNNKPYGRQKGGSGGIMSCHPAVSSEPWAFLSLSEPLSPHL